MRSFATLRLTRFNILGWMVFALVPLQAQAAQLRIAVASNFKSALTSIAQQFEAASAHKTIIIAGSTGKHYAQIRHGAPYDLFFAADVRRAKLLEQQGVAVAGSRFTYAIGRLVLWSTRENFIDAEAKVLRAKTFRRLAIANPKLAPYGMAAREVLQASDLWAPLQSKLVRGENINQAFLFVKSGNAELGFVAYSQIKNTDYMRQGSVWLVPQTLYSPIRQQAVILKDSKAAREFMTYMKTAAVLQVISEFGYDTP